MPPRAQHSAGLAADVPLLFWPAGGKAAQVSTIESFSGVKTVYLVLDACDCVILAAQVPALSAQKLTQALPNIIEDQLLQDASQVVIALGEKLSDGLRQLAVVDRTWLEQIRTAFERKGIKVAAIWPASLAIAKRPGRWVVAATGNTLALRTEQSGMGWPAGDSDESRLAALHGLFDTALLKERLAPDAMSMDALIDDARWAWPIKEFSRVRDIRFEVFTLPRPQGASTDFVAAAAGRMGKDAKAKKFQWAVWRWPIGLAIGCLAALLIGLNAQWWVLEREKTMLKTQAEQTFRAAFPSATVVQNPVLQAQRLVNGMRLQAGQSAPDDFAVLVRKMSDSLEAVATDSLASVDYAEGRLKVKFQPGYADTREAREQLQQKLLKGGLRLQFDTDREPVATVSVNS